MFIICKFSNPVKQLCTKSFICMLGILCYTRGVYSAMSSNSSNFGIFSIAYVTTPSEDVAKKLAEGLLKQKLAGCVNIIPSITSIYEWKNEIQKDSEVLMMIKTRTTKLEELTTYVRQNHPYEVCEVISTPIQAGNPSYLKWLGEVVPEHSPSQ